MNAIATAANKAAANLKAKLDYNMVSQHCTAAVQALNEIAASTTPEATADALLAKHGRNPYDNWQDMANTVVRNEINALRLS